jgi:peptidoglycan/LPS O-acetylase OafA/YrhL
LDFLRAVAVLLVLFGHTIKFLASDHFGPFNLNWLGGFGVALFFVHTSLVLMLSLERSELSGAAMVTSFYIRRFFRIYPLSCVVVTLAFVTGIPQARIEPHAILAVQPSAALLLSNLSLTQNLAGQKNLLGQLWSLPVEVDMYLLLPLLFVLARKCGRSFQLLVWPCAVCVALFFDHFDRLAVVASFTRFAPCFVPGVLAFSLSKRTRAFFPAIMWPSFLCLAVLAFMLFPGWRTAWVCCLMIGTCVASFRELPFHLLNKVTHAIAKYSYGIYLGHTLCIWASFVALRGIPFSIQLLVYPSMIVGVPLILFHLIEQPGIDLGKRLTSSIVPKRVAAVA